MNGSALHHVDLVVSSIERSLPFYRDLLAPLGFHRIGEVVVGGTTVRFLPDGPRGRPELHAEVFDRADF